MQTALQNHYFTHSLAFILFIYNINFILFSFTIHIRMFRYYILRYLEVILQKKYFIKDNSFGNVELLCISDTI